MAKPEAPWQGYSLWLDHRSQPAESKLCGHACVAMFGRSTIEEAIELIGHKRATQTAELAEALRKLGFETDHKLRRVDTGRPMVARPAIFKVVAHPAYQQRGWHWVAWDGKIFFDPAEQGPKSWLGGVAKSMLRVWRPGHAPRD